MCCFKQSSSFIQRYKPSATLILSHPMVTTVLDNRCGQLKSQLSSLLFEVRQTRKDALCLPTTLCIQISIYSIHDGWGSFRFVQSLDSLVSKQSQPHLQSGRILSLSPFVEDEEMAIKWVTAYLIIGPLPFSAGNSLQQPCGKYQGGFHSL